jgi:hypothetical protein
MVTETTRDDSDAVVGAVVLPHPISISKAATTKLALIIRAFISTSHRAGHSACPVAGRKLGRMIELSRKTLRFISTSPALTVGSQAQAFLRVARLTPRQSQNGNAASACGMWKMGEPPRQER